MKTRILLSLALSLFSFSQIGLAQWVQFDPGAGENQFTISISAVDENTAWGVTAPFGFIETKEFFRTVDAGETWTVADMNGASDGFYTLHIFALDENTAWATRLSIPGQDHTEILKTTDGGVTWTPQTIPNTLNHTAVVAVHFFNENEGTAFGETFDGTNWSIEAYWTDDGGENWQLADDPGLTGDQIWVWVGNNHYEALGDNIWFGTSQGRIFQSKDKGKNWEAYETGLVNRTIHSLSFKDELHGIAVSFWSSDVDERPNLAIRTSDGGRTWTQSPIPDNPPAGSIECIPGSGGVYILNGAAFFDGALISRDNGNTWKTLSDAPLDCIQFISPTVGWAGGQIDISPGMFRWDGGEQLFDPTLVNVKTIAGSGIEGHGDGVMAKTKLYNPMGMTMDGQGNVYIADDYNGSIRKLAPNGTVSTFAGTGVPGYANGPGNQAQFYRPQDVVCDSEGNLYVADAVNYVVRKITPDGTVSLHAGQPGVSGSADGPALEASFGWCPAIGIDAFDNLYLADGNGIRKIDAEGQVSTIWESGIFIWGLDADRNGNVYFGNWTNGTIQKLSNEGDLETIAGGFGCMDGPNGTFGEVADVAVDGYGNVYVADGTDNKVRKIDLNGEVSTVAGEGCYEGYGTEYKIVDGAGSEARFGRLRGILVKPDGNLLVNSWDNDAIREVMLGTQPRSLVVLESKTSKRYQVTPLSQWEPIAFKGTVVNHSEDEVAEVELNVEVKLDGQKIFDESSPSISIGSNEEVDFEVPVLFDATEVGTYLVTFKYSVGNQGIFQTIYDEFTISEDVLAVDDGHRYFSDSQNDKSFGQEYELINGDSIRGFSASMFSQGASFNFRIFEMDGLVVGEQIFSTATLNNITNSSQTDFFYELPENIYLEPGRYLIALVREGTDGTLGLGADTDRNDKTAWHRPPGSTNWLKYVGFWGGPTAPVFMLRPVFQPEVTTDVDEVEIPFEVQVFPNPATNQVNISLLEMGTYQLRLLSFDGKELRSATAQRGTTTFPLKDLAAGNYLLEISNEKGKVIRHINKL